MLKIFLKIFIAGMLFTLLPGEMTAPARAADAELAKNSTLEGIMRRGKLRIGLESGYLPFAMIDKRSGLRPRAVFHSGLRKRGRNVSLMGFDVDLGMALAKALGVKPAFYDTRWPAIIPALRLGRFDIIFGGMSITEARKKEVDFTDPLMTIGQTILLNAKHSDKVHSYKDLNDPRYVVVSKPATTGEEAVRKLIPKATYEPADTEAEGAMRVLRGTADAFVYDYPFNDIFSRLHPKAPIVFLDKPFTREQIAWAIRKNDPDFLKFLNEFIAQIKKDGRYSKIYNKWFVNTQWYKWVYQER